MQQFPAAVFSRRHIRGQAKTEAGHMDFMALPGTGRGLKGSGEPLAFKDNFQYARTLRRPGWNGGISPELSVENKGRRKYAIGFPTRGVSRLPLRPFARGERIAPAEVVPIMEVKCDRHEILPEPRLVFQIAQPRLRRRTTAASLRSEKLEQMGPRWFAFEDHLAGLGGRGGKSGDEKECAFDHV